MSRTHAEVKIGFVKDLNETSEDLGKKTRECDALRAEVGELDTKLVTLRDSLKVNNEKIHGIQLHVALDARAIAHMQCL